MIDFIREYELIDKPKSCSNKCIFCFIDQLPKGVRDTLLLKDDDYRLSFFSGNYVTLTNIEEADIEKIINNKLSPINISVHATDSNVRSMMLRNEEAGNLLEIMDRLNDAGISMNA